MKVKIISNTQVGTDSIEHLIGKAFDVHSIDDGEVRISYEGHLLPLDEDEYTLI